MNDIKDHSAIITLRGRQIDLSARTYVMGVLNVTPDSFSDGGRYLDPDIAFTKAQEMVDEGADIIDVGGESTRPKGVYGDGAARVSADEEVHRVLPVIERIVRSLETIVSVDTTKSSVADAAVKAGASIINDISGLRFDPAIADVAAASGAALVVMHIRGTPETMQMNPQYTDVVAEVMDELQESIERSLARGAAQLIVDPGIGFGKNLSHNCTILKHLHRFKELGYPVMVGPSRKGFIGTLLDLPVDQRLEGTAASIAAAILNGANIVRVHDVKEMKRVAVVADAIRNAQ